jgi:GMP synthase (glutamine-hydrolysing)
VSAEELGKHELVAIILSGGPSSVYDKDAPHVHEGVWKLIEERQIPVLGICYGMQELAHVFGGEVAPGLKHEYGKSFVKRVEGCNSKIFDGMPEAFQMWMSHGDKLTKTPEGFKPVGKFRRQRRIVSVPECNQLLCAYITNILKIHSGNGECRVCDHRAS